ncbi:hypothetical protein CYPRO_3029 [Cyclonatronum proteinivorum]|uniref:Uncharacterized protein n=1 Tax=Cyclonatronum proteinivorum TaxID=1457365 RepID=A0A345UP64_9BACT|nr:hypothetical protein [Cyclonatronum proteinivorum]AXJ02266.1 hypothetical protein CYPRO_3029 [Cyclonatronum proteinivorum]
MSGTSTKNSDVHGVHPKKIDVCVIQVRFIILMPNSYLDSITFKQKLFLTLRNHTPFMQAQIIKNKKGETKGVFIPIAEWRRLKKDYGLPDHADFTDAATDGISEELHQAIKELEMVMKGELKARPASELLDEL